MLVAHAVDTLTRLGATGPTLSALEGIPILESFTMDVVPPVAELVGPLAELAGPSMPVQAQADMPIVLPEVHIAPKDQKAHYSLPKAPRFLEPLASQMKAFKAWCTNGIQLDRQGASVANRTWENVCSTIFLFLGFLHFFMKVAQPTLHAFTLAAEFAKYVSFRVSKATSINTLTQQISHAKKVLQFLRLAANVPEALQIDIVGAWMDKLKGQLVSMIPKKRKDPVQLEEQGGWKGAPEIVSLLDNLRHTALRGVLNMDEDLCTPASAMILYDACLSNFMFGHLPPLRLSCLRTMQLPYTEACLDPECHDIACKGNRLLFKEGMLWASLPHHKNQKRLESLILEVQLPQELAELAIVYMNKAHPILFPGGMPFMFPDRHGKQMGQASTLTNWWHKLLKRLGCRADFPPHMLRHIFVDERMSHASVAGPSNIGAAQVMGNSVQQWERAYDLKLSRRETQAAVSAMGEWRKAMLEQAKRNDKGKGKMIEEEPHEGDNNPSTSFETCG